MSRATKNRRRPRHPEPLTDFFFSDNTVLINFGLVDRVDLLGAVLDGSGRWCASVAVECERSSDEDGLDCLREVWDHLGEPVHPTQAEQVNTLILRDRMASPMDHRRKHLGEAETLAVMSERFQARTFVTDDTEACRIAESLGIATQNTMHLLQRAVHDGHCDCTDMLDYLEVLRQNRRQAPLITSVTALREWAGMPPPEVMGFGEW